MINEMENGKDKAVGKVKEAAGKFMKDDDLEFQGKMQNMKAGIGNKVENVKDAVLEKANDVIDKVKEIKKDQ